MKYACIASHRTHYPIGLMCQTLGVSRSGFFAWQAREKAPGNEADAPLREAIAQVHKQSRRRYGRRRVTYALRAQGWSVNPKRVRRVMRQEGLRGVRKGRFVPCTTDSAHQRAIAPNVLQRRFGVDTAVRAWTSDITYVATCEGWLYLAVIIALQTRSNPIHEVRGVGTTSLGGGVEATDLVQSMSQRGRRLERREARRKGKCVCWGLKSSPALVQPKSFPALTERELLDRNRSYYDMLWSGARLVEPQRFNTWPLVQLLLPTAARRLEVAPGLRPRLPIEGTQFLDISAPAAAKLRAHGAQIAVGKVTCLPFADDSFDVVCAFDIIEHVDDDDGALSELSRVAKPGAAVLMSVPLHPALWTAFDDFVGHKRRYEPSTLPAKLSRHRLIVERSAVFGMQPRSSLLVDLGTWWLLHHRGWAMWWYNRVIMQLGLLFQQRLTLASGMIATDGVDEVLLVCRRQSHKNEPARK